MCTPFQLPRGSLRASNPLREGQSANRDKHVGISRTGPRRAGRGGTGLLGKVVGVYSTASVRHRIELRAGLLP